ncbi:MAG TPA: VOC family protein [Ktedonobacterales bacterium]|jgi:predicted enzyme related to lactoylglutathione lyase|nr:VOC family protein [Ktedonobacterales bacterium]
MFTSLTPNLMVEDVAQTVAFYRDALGFAVTDTAPEQGAPVWATVRAGAVSLMFQARPSLEEELPVFAGRPIGGALTLYIGVDDADALYARVHDKAQVVKEPVTMPYHAREFYIQDPNGYILGFSSPIASDQAADAQ